MGEMVVLRKKKGDQARSTGGVEIAEPLYTRRSEAEVSTPRSSNYFGSGDSIAGSELHSSVPSGYTSTDSSCRVSGVG